MSGTAVASGSLARPGLDPSRDLSSVNLPPWILEGSPDAVCLRSDPETFFPDNYGLQYRDQIEYARGRCDFCPLLPLCRQWAVPRTDLDGIWAATTPPERRRIRTGRLVP